MKKKAELTTQQLITIIILIVSFSVILFFIFRLNLGGEATNKEICHNSVLLKSKSPIGGALDCRTSYICISGGGKCDNFVSSQEVVKVDLINSQASADVEKNKKEVMKAIAEEMADCWWMFGEGKVDYIDSSLWEKIKDKITGDKICSICSRIKFNKEIQGLTIDSNSFKNFLANNEKSKGVSYSDYLYNLNDAKNIGVGEIKLDTEYYILTGIAKEGALKSVWNLVSKAMPPNAFFLDKDDKLTDKGSLPVKIIKKSDLDNENCGDFVTKS